jgi:hypothetical protein
MMRIRSGWTWLFALSTSFYIWMMSNIPLVAIPEAMHDDALFVRIAANILDGRWLGDYNNLTLSKGPFYPAWISMNWIIGLPLIVSQAIIYSVSCFILVLALQRWMKSAATAFAIFITLLFNPVTYTLGQLRVMREGIYLPMTILILAIATWWIRWGIQKWTQRAWLAAGLGAVLAAYWCTREEGIWILPALGLCFAMSATAAIRRNGLRVGLTREVGLAALTAVVATSLIGAVAGINYRYYGVFQVVEFKQPEFISAYGALSRIKHRNWTTYVVVPREVLSKAYAVSPRAAELQPYLDGSGSDGFISVGCSTYSIEPCDGEIRAGWFMWALRDAVANTGHYASARLAKRFYAQLADEINMACANGALDCLPERQTLIPPFRWDYIKDTAVAAAKMGAFMATFESAVVPSDPMACVVDDCGQIRRYAYFLDIVRTSIFIRPPWLAVDEFRRRSTSLKVPVQKRSAVIASAMSGITTAYRTLMPWLLAAGAMSYILACQLSLKRRQIEPLLAAASIAGIVVVTRIGLLAYLDATAIPSQNSLYLSPAYPALVLFATLSIVSLISQYRRTAQRSPAAATDANPQIFNDVSRNFP